MTSRWAMDDILANDKMYVPHLFYANFSEFEFHRIQREIEREPMLINAVRLDYVQTGERLEIDQFFSVKIMNGERSHLLMPGELAVWFLGDITIFSAVTGSTTTLRMQGETELPSVDA